MKSSPSDPRLRARVAVLVIGCLWPLTAHALDLHDSSRLRIGVGDRLEMQVGRSWISLPKEALEHGFKPELFAIWLPQEWEDDWLDSKRLVRLARAGITPVIVHYYFGDAISKERVEGDREGWFTSLRRMARLIEQDAPVLVILEPEWNIEAPPGDTAIVDWPGFADDLKAAAKMIREMAPNALIGTCPGDFAGPRRLEGVLGKAAADLDFIAFQEMRGKTDPDAGRPGYRDVAGASIAFARYLKKSFDRPILLGYLAFSSWGGWADEQRDAIEALAARRGELLSAGVFGALYFQLRDDPGHTGYFGPAERNFGLLDAQGRPKPAFDAFRKLGEPLPRPASRARP